MTLRAALGTLVTMLLGLALLPGVATAAPVSGSTSDARDALIHATTGLRVADLKSMDVTHDPETGELVVGVELWAPLQNTPDHSVYVSAAVSFLRGDQCTPYQTAETTFSLSAYVPPGQQYRS